MFDNNSTRHIDAREVVIAGREGTFPISAAVVNVRDLRRKNTMILWCSIDLGCELMTK